MGVIYKLREEVVDFIISQRQSHPLASCRELAESASEKFSLHLSKSSVHDVLKECGITTPRGRKPKDRFEIPQEKKKQIQTSLSQVKLLPDPVEEPVLVEESVILNKGTQYLIQSEKFQELSIVSPYLQNDVKISPEYEAAGKIFLKAALWDLGIFSEENIKAGDWNYYLTYVKGISVALENNMKFFIDLPLPLERCIREMVDGVVNNVRPLIVDQVSDKELFKSCMEAEAGHKITSVSIVDRNDHILIKIYDLMEYKRKFILEIRTFVENNKIDMAERSKLIFFPPVLNNKDIINNIIDLKGFDTESNDEKIVTLLISETYDNKDALQKAADKLNSMYLYDEQNRLVKVKIQAS